ncbi:FAD-binding oxidoreductase [Microtetraspora sp. NBRC 16547]|uniref:FAD-binding oxidoreductase n=1 Tax=Microtetraspora sp. NBRC 16547 TaxID=3030993 RepID=UPI0024A50C8C|nr:FAD-binding oxidoreductase [Microtetraspora sp. NBRC 16547]GLW99266.1 FAD-linked oxidase [Microtetraspora sp. NBRC 16547]
MSVITGDPAGLSREAESLRREVDGPVLLPGDEGFTTEVTGFNVAIRHTPALVVGATGVGDVQAAVRFAARQGLPVAVQATGHGAVMPVDGAVLITTGRMHAVTVDPSACTATIAAGTTWAEVIEHTTPHGLAPLCGSAPGVGAIGYTLGGGTGPIARTYGFAADHVRELTLVTADGQARTVDAVREPDLFWALRGGKGSFGVVTSMTIDLFPVATLYGGGIFFPAEDASRVLHAYRDWVGTLPETTTTSVALLRLPPLPELPPMLRGRFVAHLRFAHIGEAHEGERLLAPMRAVGSPLIDAVAPMPFAAIGSIHQDPTDPMPSWERGALLRELTADTVDAILATAGPEVEAPFAVVEVRHLGGALARPARPENAVGGRDAAFSLLIIGAPVPELFASVIPGAAGALIGAVEPWLTGGCLLNFQGTATRPEEIARVWPRPVLRRLARLREVHDPQRVFRFGHAVPDLPEGED